MATIINDPRKIRVYHDRPEFRDSVEPYDEATDQMMADSVPDIESDSGFNSPEVEEAVSQALNSKLVRQPNLGIIDWNTSNKSFISLSKDLHTLGIKNNTFFLKLFDKTLQGVDPYMKDLPIELKLRIVLECRRNPWYFLREVCRIPADGKPITVGGGISFNIDRNSLASWYLFLNNIDHYTSKPRQTGKTQNALAEIDWAFHFGSMSSTFTFANKDAANNKLNLYRLKCQRDMLPVYIQMKLSVDDTGKLIKEKNNVMSMSNPITMNTINLLPRANSSDAANSNGRGMTASLMYFDEFDFEPYNTTTLSSSAFAYATASANAIKNGNVACRLFTSTPGDLDSRDGGNAAEFIEHMLVWNDSMLDWPIEKLKAYANDTKSKRNGIIYVEHSWRQLKKSNAWYEEQCRLAEYKKEVILREIDLRRLHGSGLSPFSRDDLLYLEAHKKSPIFSLDLSRNGCPINFLESLNKKTPYILSIDTAEGLAGDNTSMQLINPYTLQTAAEFQSPYISPKDMCTMVEKFMTDYCPRAMIVVENNRGRELINRLREGKYAYHLWYDSGKLAEISEKLNKYGNPDAAKNSLISRTYGFTTHHTNRDKMYDILNQFVQEYKQRLIGPNLVKDISTLIRNKVTLKVSAAPGQHDDSVMAYLIGVYVFLFADNLLEFGLNRNMIDPDERLILANKVEETPMETLRRIFNQLPEDVQVVFGDQIMAKTEKEKSYEYAMDVQRAREASPLYRLNEFKEEAAGYADPYTPTDFMSEDQRMGFMDRILMDNDDPTQTIFDVNDYV